ncbi:MAG: hypothetical protein V9G04_11945 [Nocardioides sp.]
MSDFATRAARGDAAPPAPAPAPAAPPAAPLAPPPISQPRSQPGFQPGDQPGDQPWYQSAGQAPPPQAYAPLPTPDLSALAKKLSWSDFARDAGALFCLFASLAMPWDLDDDGAGHWWVVLGVLIAALALGVPYVRLLAPGLQPAAIGLIKAALGLPLAMGILLAVGNELININDLGEGGIGTGVGMAMAGLFLAIQPRQTEDDPLRGSGWVAAAKIAAVLALVSAAGYSVLGLWGIRDVGDYVGWDYFAWIILGTLVVTLIVHVPAALSMLSSHPGGPVLMAVLGFTVLGVSLLARGPGSDSFEGYDLLMVNDVEKWNSLQGGVLAIGAAAALAVARPVVARVRQYDRQAGFVATGKLLLLTPMLGAIAFTLSVAFSIVLLGDVTSTSAGKAVGLFLSLIATAMAITATLILRGSAGRKVAMVISAVLVVLWTVVVAVLRDQDGTSTLLARDVAWLFTIPTAALIYLALPSVPRLMANLQGTATPVPQAAPPGPWTAGPDSPDR